MYESFYNLNAKPFALSPDPHFYFGSKEHNRVLAYLRYGIKQAEGFIVVTGEVGTGKTTLVGALLSELEEHKELIVAQLVTTQLGPDDLLRMVASSFNLKHEKLKKATLLNNLEAFFKQQHKEGKRALLVVDEAQNLEPYSLEELRMLSNFQIGNKSLLQSFLIGQAELRDTLTAEGLEQFRQRIIASYHLGPMGLDETNGYIEHRLRVAGWREDPKITQGAYAAIYAFSGGIPRRINTLCDRVFLYSYLEELHEINEDTINAVTKELKEELPYTYNGTEELSKEEKIVANISKTNASSTTAKEVKRQAKPDAKGTLNERVSDLQARVDRLEDITDKARDLLKAIISD